MTAQADVLAAMRDAIDELPGSKAAPLDEARAAVAELIGPQTAEDLGEILAAIQKAHSVCSELVKLAPKIGPVYSHANSAAWGLTQAIKRVERISAALARCKGAQS